MAGRTPKALWKHLREGTFQARRHRDRLLTEPVPPEFEQMAQLYRLASSDRQRSAIGVDAQEASRRGAVDRGPVRVEIDLTTRPF